MTAQFHLLGLTWPNDDPELGPMVKLQISEEAQPSFASVQAESEFTKRQ